MPFERLPFDAESYLTDVRMFQQEGFGAIYLIDDERKAIVETGTSHEVDRVLEAIRSFGLKPTDIDAMIDLGLAGIAELVRVQNAVLASIGIDTESLLIR